MQTKPEASFPSEKAPNRPFKAGRKVTGRSYAPGSERLFPSLSGGEKGTFQGEPKLSRDVDHGEGNT